MAIIISENGIDKLIMDLDEYAINARKIFDRIEAAVEDVNRDCKAKISTKYVNRFEAFASNFSIITNNILSYKKDLQDVKRQFKTEQSMTAAVLEEHAKEVKQ
jgi:hypothetical protein